MSHTPPTLQYASASHARPYSRFAVFVICASAAIFAVPMLMMSIASSVAPVELYRWLFATENQMYAVLLGLPLACLLLSVFAHARLARVREWKRGHALSVIAVLLSLVNLGFGCCAGELIRGIDC